MIASSSFLTTPERTWRIFDGGVQENEGGSRVVRQKSGKGRVGEIEGSDTAVQRHCRENLWTKSNIFEWYLNFSSTLLLARSLSLAHAL